MSAIEGAFCRSSPWRAFARRRMLPWALDGFDLHGDVLEIGAGSGAMAQGVARTLPDARLTVTDLDEAMVAAAAARLHRHPGVRVERADVTALPYPGGSFDVVTAYLMLHHVGDWRDSLSESARVLRPGGVFIGYDLTDTPLARAVHRLEGSAHRIIAAAELREALAVAGFTDIAVDTSVREHLMRFRAFKRAV
ncbi:MAG: class I SAM-dependent methyltransferase [Intrasporangium sp.]|uniref:class I SAM-dependent methyltransferase n=1 Tax=Intrasporangium sp. TaxID=1925024 RepID=UPI002649A2AC|nr:class I SAM-dependent methyltransferase [Intrasporangium sp.]MDN5798159.1 class I SAM-dependent methyltransferase [Intrasporangium sp.]